MSQHRLPISLSQTSLPFSTDVDDEEDVIRVKKEAVQSSSSSQGYDGSIYPVEQRAQELIDHEQEQSLVKQQPFVRRFLSIQDPRNSLLLFHGLGTGKTYSALSICKEWLQYQQALYQQEFASHPNTFVIWFLANSTLLEQFEQVLQKQDASSMLSTHVHPIEYDAFVHMVSLDMSNNQISKYSHTLIIIDEAHQLVSLLHRPWYDTLFQLASYAIHGLQWLLLTATPVVQDPSEIIQLLNLMRVQDRRPYIPMEHVFYPTKEHSPLWTKVLPDLKHISLVGKQRLGEMAGGYVSYVRGENPYTFPFRIYPSLFDPARTFRSKEEYPNQSYTQQLDLNNLDNPLTIPKLLFETYPLFLSPISIFWQQQQYQSMLSSIMSKHEHEHKHKHDPRLASSEENQLLSLLNISYPDNKTLRHLCNLNQNGKYEYTTHTRIFHPNELPKYSAKLHAVCGAIDSTLSTGTGTGTGTGGILLVCSRYWTHGLLPMALALEERGYTRHPHPSSNIGSLLDTISTSTSTSTSTTHTNLKYTLLCCSNPHAASWSNSKQVEDDLKIINDPSNLRGDQIRVVLMLSQDAEGIDFKAIRQIHVLDPPSSISELEQILGRGARHKSHIGLPFQERNVQIYLHATVLPRSVSNSSSVPIIQEAMDVYVYRREMIRATKLGEITRVLKEVAVDCELHHGQVQFTVENMNQVIEQVLVNGQRLDNVVVGDKPHSAICDYSETCMFSCIAPSSESELKHPTQSGQSGGGKKEKGNLHEMMNQLNEWLQPALILNLKDAMKWYGQPSSRNQWKQAISELLVEYKQRPFINKYGHPGTWVLVQDWLLFQPLETFAST